MGKAIEQFSSAKRHYSPFQLPNEAKVVTLFTFLLAVLSIIRTNPTTAKYFDENDEYYRKLFAVAPVDPSSKQNHSLNVAFRPRIIFMDGKPWNKSYAVDGKDLPRSQPAAVYPLLVRQRVNTSKEDRLSTDPTRFYHLADSKDLPDMERRQWPHHDFDPKCVPMAKWQSSLYPVCNIIHAENDIRGSLVDKTFTVLSNKGYWRSAWRHDGWNQTGSTASSPLVWKTFKIFHNFEEKYYEDNRVDALAMERLTGSPFIIRIYGFCGLTVVQEFGSKDLAQVVDGMKSSQKLVLARQIAKGLSDIHSIKGDNNKVQGVTLVHNDINMANVMFTSDNRPILNDFNIAILRMKNNETGEPCPFYSKFPNPQWKAPEEQVLDDETKLADYHPPIVNDEIDVYAMGNLFFRIIVGYAPWKRPEAERLYADEKPIVARLKRYNGTLPLVPPDITFLARSDPALSSLLQAMRNCYRYNPSLRPTAAEMVKFLDQEIQNINKK